MLTETFGILIFHSDWRQSNLSTYFMIVSHTSIGADIEKKRKKHREENDKKLIT